VDTVEGKLATARSRLDREKSQYDSQRLESAVSVGSTLLGALLGRRSVTSSRAASAARQVGRASTQRDDVQRAEKSIDELTDRLARIEAELAEKLEQVRDEWDVDALEIEEVSLSPRKSEIGVDLVALAWVEEATREV
jgi:phage-related minor tail protein